MNVAKTTENGSSSKKFAKPLHLQRLEASLDMGPFMAFAHKMLSQPLASSDSDTDDEEHENDGVRRAGGRFKGINGSKEERQSDKAHVYNLSSVTSEREWLCDALLSDTETDSDISDEDDHIKDMLRSHLREQKYRESYYKKEKNTQYGYYGTGLLSAYDMFPEHQRSIVGVRKRRKEREKKEKPPKIPKPRKQRRSKHGDASGSNDPKAQKWAASQHLLQIKSEFGEDDMDSKSRSPMGSLRVPHSGRGRKKKSAMAKTPELMAARRRKVFQLMSKKELGKIQRAKANNHKEMLQGCKRVATMCMKVTRQKAMQSQKIMKETVWRAKRLTREMQGYWKRYDRVERETRRRMEKEAEEQRKIDVEIIEAKRQQRKLNFLITQTELYAHFMSKKLGFGTEEEQLRILNQLDEEINPRLSAYDDYDSELMKQLAQRHAAEAFNTDRAKTQQFDVQIKEESEEENPSESMDCKPDLPQPNIFRGTLKTYQLKGMTWLANIYDQGISGILADEMGLGKTVQSIAFLCHIAEKYGVWGPFLVISPASTLHNWQQEMQRFVPDFNVVPYWGSPNERKILRQFWEQKDLHTKDASFHVVITSYQLIVSDYKYFNRIKWQYMILDEAQAIKSSSSMRWKLLLGFNCRNRLLLSGTPIQNSMAELWALLHFIMPTLFDSHDEFNEWFSKDIESHAENKTGIDEKQISRLHMILKPFMLRRIKKDVENELSDKIEIMVYCPLTTRQKLLYMALKKKIRIEDLLHFTIGGNDGHHVDRNFTSNLMNLVMQFRKVCNHPELFERRDAKSPFSMKCEEYVMPRLVFNEALLSCAASALPSKKHLLYNRFNIFKTEHVQRSLFYEKPRKKSQQYPKYVDVGLDSAFSFSRFCDFSPKDIEDMTVAGLIGFLKNYLKTLREYADYAYRLEWWENYSPTKTMLLEPLLQNILDQRLMAKCSALKEFIFTRMTSSESSIYTFGDYQIANMQESIEHRVIRSRNRKITEIRSPIEGNLLFKSELDTDDDFARPVVVKEESKTFTSPPRGRPPKNPDKSVKSSTILLPEFPHIPKPPRKFFCEAIEMPRFLYGLGQKVQAVKRRTYCESRAAEWAHIRHIQCDNQEGYNLLHNGLELCKPKYGWSSIVIPDKQTLVSDAGKLAVLDSLLTRLKAQGHRVLIYSQMTKMIDLLEEYMWHRKHRYMRLDGSSKISARRDMVADFQNRADIFVFLLSTRAGGLGINLTAADTVIFYDSDWNPTVDQQAMDRAHRLGQTKQVTVYRLICKGTIEERILQRAREKSEIQRMVISGGNFKPDTLKPKEVVSLLLDDEEIELKYRQKTEEDKSDEIMGKDNSDKKRRLTTKIQPADGSTSTPDSQAAKRIKLDIDDDSNIDVGANSPVHSNDLSHTESFVPGATPVMRNDESSNEALIVDCDTPLRRTSPSMFNHFESIGRSRRRHHPRGTKRGRPRGSRRGGGNGSLCRSGSTPVRSTPSNESNLGGTTTEHLTNSGEGGFVPTITPVKRGPGRPRLKPGGPPNPGTRGTPRPRKPIGPLVVPLGQSPAATPVNRSPAISPAPSPASERSAYFQSNEGEN
ncbi:chromatin-remodeling ATPase INO80 [Eupeodes corollae]|uniref:chromatin-remodeling ATPase INO80 n=1 Tax=Eupeodes corollae TaxID=290404 RepID=UPI002490D472|nr:chromatin-remodeling ATPase INO80 [Eupeodes corollae]